MSNSTIIRDIEIIKRLLGLSDEDVAEALGITRLTLARWKKGTDAVSDSYREKVYGFAYDNGVRLNLIKEQLYRDDFADDDHIILFHGAKNELQGQISLEHSRTNNDFGRGFYCGDSFNQSAMFVSSYDASRVYITRFDMAFNYKYKKYYVDNEWMMTIAMSRGRLGKYKDHPVLESLANAMRNLDFVIAPIADNRMFQLIDDFANGLITDVQCQYALAATDLGNQYVFLSESAIDGLSVMDECYLSKAEKKKYIKEKMESNRIGHDKSLLIQREHREDGRYIDQILE